MKYFLLLAILSLVPVLAAAEILSEKLRAIENETGGILGVAVLDTESQHLWHYNGDLRFPMMSTFKTLACAKMLHDHDKSLIDSATEYPVIKAELVVWSPITKDLVGQSISLFDACEATMLTSDNTAANIALKQIGGPPAVTQFLRTYGDPTTRIDRYEPELNQAVAHDPRDTTTPKAMTETLSTLLLGTTLSKTSAQQLKQWMQNNTISDALLRSVLPSAWQIADRTGAGENGSRGITAIIWNSSRPPIILSIYLTQTQLSLSERNAVIAEIGNAVFHHYHVQ
ncbi:class A beta-lactamase [Alteromonas facilis]|uniref:class A beta-lactamase n=1 Tax=Alteromonas facilis TaxID=2048004 RepID=UPI003B839536